MADRVKIIKSLQEIVDDYRNAGEEFTDGLEVDFLEDVLSLLKEQEEQLSIKKENFNRLVAKIEAYKLTPQELK